jgi:demethylmenaquinone methyltransferase/2-methoxy-6-polyprenyl-1,4-benzoquinol methylase
MAGPGLTAAAVAGAALGRRPCARLDAMTRAQLDRRPREVSAMFDSVAARYDLLNDVLSAGQDRRWRARVTRAVRALPGELVLDLAAGTSSRGFARTGAHCIACDFSLGMLATGAAKPAPGVTFVAGDALRLPFADATFDAVTISFGLRNVADAGAALAEMRRVTVPGGRLLICEFSHLTSPRLDRLFGQYLHRALPAIAGRLSGNAAAYEYLAESISDWPAQAELAARIRAAGWSNVRWLSLTFGVVALHAARC